MFYQMNLTLIFISDATCPLDDSFNTSSRSPISRAMFDQSSNFSCTRAVSKFSVTLKVYEKKQPKFKFKKIGIQ